jgi:hypothetical protein
VEQWKSLIYEEVRSLQCDQGWMLWSLIWGDFDQLLRTNGRFLWKTIVG